MTPNDALLRVKAAINGRIPASSLTMDEKSRLCALNAPLLDEQRNRLTEIAAELERLSESDAPKIDVNIRVQVLLSQAAESVQRIERIHEITSTHTLRSVQEMRKQSLPDRRTEGPLSRLIRLHYGSQAKFAEAIDVSQTTVSNWMQRRPTAVVKYVDVICDSGRGIRRAALIKAAEEQQKYIDAIG